jgi:hypothetical protein
MPTKMVTATKPAIMTSARAQPLSGGSVSIGSKIFFPEMYWGMQDLAAVG